jgi:SET domain-containing protein
MMFQSDAVQMKRSIGKGRGVFARRPIKKGEVIESVPVLLIPAEAVVDGVNNKWLGKYYYWWDDKRLAVSLGYGSLYNHSYKPNATYEHGHASITYRALRNIPKGEEICINYNWDPKDLAELSFKVV